MSDRPNVKISVKLAVNQLQVGMFVAELDRDWLETPFPLQGFFIRSQSDIDALSDYCKHVYILSTGKLNFSGKVDFESGVLIGRKPVQYPISASFSDEFPAVHSLSGSIREHVKSMLHRIREGELVSVPEARKLVEKSVESVIRHPDAITFMTRLRGLDDYTTEHCMNVCLLAVVFGRRLGLRKQQLINLGLCGLLHDAGKARVPPEILNKPGRLDERERKIMMQHPALGKSLLEEKKDAYQEAVEVAFSHHERPDGKGYPRGLPAKDISLFTKIISIVDVYDAVTGDRVYAKGRPITDAMRIIYEGRGSQFDADLALAFLQTIGVYPPGTLVELANGCLAVVADRSKGPRHLPTVLVLTNTRKQRVLPHSCHLSQSVDGGFDRGYLIRRALPDGCYGIQLKTLVDQQLFSRETDNLYPPLD